MRFRSPNIRALSRTVRPAVQRRRRNMHADTGYARKTPELYPGARVTDQAQGIDAEAGTTEGCAQRASWPNQNPRVVNAFRRDGYPGEYGGTHCPGSSTALARTH